MVIKDLRKNLLSIESQELYQIYLFPRPSSQCRIIVNTFILGYCGFFYGIAKGIKLHQSLFKNSLQYFGVGMLIGYTHIQFNEIATGLLIRNFQRDQYWITNTFASILNCFGIYSVLNMIEKKPGQFIQAQKTAGAVCIISMFLDLLSQTQRYAYLNFQQ